MSQLTLFMEQQQPSELSAATAFGLSAEDSQAPRSKQRSKTRRKHSYLTRKDEMKQLATDAETLTFYLASLKATGFGDLELYKRVNQNEALRNLLRMQQLSLWKANSMLLDQLKAPHLNPLTTFIHLTCDPQQRRDTLEALHDQKIEEGRRFVITRSQGLDLFAPFRTVDLRLNPQGDYCCDRYDINQFYGVQSLQQVYEALLFCLHIIEISITEKLGHITLREDYDSVKNRISHQRLVSCDDNGVLHEMNGVMFMQFVDRGPDDSYGVISSDCIDVDDLYPYQPELNVRKDIMASTLITAHRRKKAKAAGPPDSPAFSWAFQEEEEEETELVVVLRRAIFVKLHRTDLKLSDSVLQDVRENVTCWNDVTVKSIRDILNGRSTSA